ncbi:MAG: phosphoglycerate mutase family protein [Muribaculaceae bacterium]|nr:phosphoglycerate mutase family protein [Muribaculaceae bacterium]
MELSEIKNISNIYQSKAFQILEDTRLIEILEKNGLRVSLVGSLRMGLLVNHRDIDLHIYSKDLTVESSFQVISKIVANPNFTETLCINGLSTDEHCMEWHLKYKDDENKIWQIDVIHIEEGTQYDGYFERMADTIVEIITNSQRDTILKLKYLSILEKEMQIHSPEIYEAVIDKGIEDFEELKSWIKKRRLEESYYWIPK